MKKRNLKVVLKVSEVERNYINKQAALLDISGSDFMRKKIFGEEIYSDVLEKTVVSELSKFEKALIKAVMNTTFIVNTAIKEHDQKILDIADDLTQKWLDNNGYL